MTYTVTVTFRGKIISKTYDLWEKAANAILTSAPKILSGYDLQLLQDTLTHASTTKKYYCISCQHPHPWTFEIMPESSNG